MIEINEKPFKKILLIWNIDFDTKNHEMTVCKIKKWMNDNFKMKQYSLKNELFLTHCDPVGLVDVVIIIIEWCVYVRAYQRFYAYM